MEAVNSFLDRIEDDTPSASNQRLSNRKGTYQKPVSFKGEVIPEEEEKIRGTSPDPIRKVPF